MHLKTLFVSTAVALASITGCSDSEIDGSRKLSSLSAAESKEVCEEAVATFPSKNVTCEGNTTIEIGFKAAECATATTAESTCAAKVSDVRACADKLAKQTDAQICADPALPSECLALAACK